jgi:hypothetical protein
VSRDLNKIPLPEGLQLLVQRGVNEFITNKVNVMSEERKEKMTIYKYTRDGVEYTTPNEQIASQRSDTGEYYIINYEQGQENSIN